MLSEPVVVSKSARSLMPASLVVGFAVLLSCTASRAWATHCVQPPVVKASAVQVLVFHYSTEGALLPLRGATAAVVDLTRSARSLLEPVAASLTDNRGQAQLSELTPGTYTLAVYHDDFYPAFRPLQVTKEEGLERLLGVVLNESCPRMCVVDVTPEAVSEVERCLEEETPCDLEASRPTKGCTSRGAEVEDAPRRP
jgi:hypothetical protein